MHFSRTPRLLPLFLTLASTNAYPRDCSCNCDPGSSASCPGALGPKQISPHASKASLGNTSEIFQRAGKLSKRYTPNISTLNSTLPPTSNTTNGTDDTTHIVAPASIILDFEDIIILAWAAIDFADPVGSLIESNRTKVGNTSYVLVSEQTLFQLVVKDIALYMETYAFQYGIEELASFVVPGPYSSPQNASGYPDAQNGQSFSQSEQFLSLEEHINSFFESIDFPNLAHTSSTLASEKARRTIESRANSLQGLKAPHLDAVKGGSPLRLRHYPRSVTQSWESLADPSIANRKERQKALVERQPGSAAKLCGTSPPSQAFREDVHLLSGNEVSSEVSRNNTIQVNVYIHVVADSEAKFLSENTLQNQRNVLSKAYRPHGIHFNFVNTSFTVEETWASSLGNWKLYGNQEYRTMRASLHRGSWADLNLYFCSGYSQGLLGVCPIPEPNAGYDCNSPDCRVAQDGCILSYDTLPGGHSTAWKRKGLTAVHEVGHWFGLLHTFETAFNEPGESPCSPDADDGDLIADTPPQSMQTDPNQGCNERQNSCKDGLGPDSIHNYMDYSADECLSEFTPGQAKRMHQIYGKYRYGK